MTEPLQLAREAWMHENAGADFPPEEQLLDWFAKRPPDEEPAYQVELPVQAVVCRTHGELFRLTWPAGYMIFCVHAVHLVLGENGSQEIKDIVGTNTSRLNAAIAEYGPLCRLMTAEQRHAAYTAAAKSASWGERAICAACRKWKMGARGMYQTPRGLEQHHVCIDCISGYGCQS